MKLIRLKDIRDNNPEMAGLRVAGSTWTEWCKSGKLPGVIKEGGEWYVIDSYVGPLLQAVRMRIQSPSFQRHQAMARKGANTRWHGRAVENQHGVPAEAAAGISRQEAVDLYAETALNMGTQLEDMTVLLRDILGELRALNSAWR